MPRKPNTAPPEGHDGQHRAADRDLPRASQCLARGQFARLLCRQLLLGHFKRFALVAQVAACGDHAAQHVVREFRAAQVEPLLDAQQAPVDQRGERVGRGAGGGEGLQHALFGQALAEARLGQHLVFDELAHAGRLVGERAFVELGENRLARAGQEVDRDLAPALCNPRVIELAADQRQQRRLDLGIAEFRAAGDEAHDRLGHLFVDQRATRLAHRVQRLGASHARQAHPVLRDRGHLALEALEVREVVLAQRDQDAVVAAREVEALDDRLVVIEPRLERLRQAVLHQVGEILDEARRALAAGVIALRQGEDLLELVEDQQRRDNPAGGVEQLVVAVMQEFPQRFAVDRRPRPGPTAHRYGRAQDRLLDLFRGLGRGRVVDAHVDRAVALLPQARDDAGVEDRSLAEPGLSEQDRQQLALHAAGEFGDLLVAAVEEAARLFGERGQTRPGLLRIDRGFAHGSASLHGEGSFRHGALHTLVPITSAAAARQELSLTAPRS